MVNSYVLQLIGAGAAPLVAALAAAALWIFRKYIASYFASKYLLIRERDTAIAERDGALRQAKTAEAANKNQADAIDALQKNLSSVNTSVEAFETKLQEHESAIFPLQAKVDAFVDWSRLMIDRNFNLENALKKNGIEVDGHMPPIPSILADRFDIPETLR